MRKIVRSTLSLSLGLLAAVAANSLRAQGAEGDASETEEDETKTIAELTAGDFFGEMALLGDHIRKADVRASTACTLLRINCKDVLDMAKTHKEIADRLNEARAARSLKPEG